MIGGHQSNRLLLSHISRLLLSWAPPPRLPAFCDPDKCFEHVWQAFECARGMFIHAKDLFTPDLQRVMSPDIVLNRLHEFSDESWQWLLNAPLVGTFSFSILNARL